MYQPNTVKDYMKTTDEEEELLTQLHLQWCAEEYQLDFDYVLETFNEVGEWLRIFLEKCNIMLELEAMRKKSDSAKRKPRRIDRKLNH